MMCLHCRAEEKKNAGPTKPPSSYAQFTKEMFPVVKVRATRREGSCVTACLRALAQKLAQKHACIYMRVGHTANGSMQLAASAWIMHACGGPPQAAGSRPSSCAAPVLGLQAKIPGAKLPEITKQISQLWKAMPEAEKKKRTDEAHARLDAYKKAKEAHDAQANGA
eukprot:scaffold116956_cov18-Tisochrysis_lutea.AAC.1